MFVRRILNRKNKDILPVENVVPVYESSSGISLKSLDEFSEKIVDLPAHTPVIVYGKWGGTVVMWNFKAFTLSSSAGDFSMTGVIAASKLNEAKESVERPSWESFIQDNLQ